MRSREVHGGASYDDGNDRTDVLTAVNKAIDEMVRDAGTDSILWDTIEISTDSEVIDVHTLVDVGKKMQRWTSFDVRALAVVSETPEVPK